MVLTISKILVINPGSTSTKIGIYENHKFIFQKNIEHELDEIKKFPRAIDQLEYRQESIDELLKEINHHKSSFDAIACRGGRLKPVSSGVYRVNKEMLSDAKIGFQGDHASNLACIIGHNLFSSYGVPVFVVDPVSVDEMWSVARISGFPMIERNSLSHALNMKRVAQEAAIKLGGKYDDCRLIVAHLGGGGSISIHVEGKMVDVYNSDKEGPFAVERSGGVPSLDLVDVCFTKDIEREKLIKKLAGEGGLYAYLGTKNMKIIMDKYNSGDEETRIIVDAYCYQVAKYIGAMAAVLEGRVDAICITGGIAYSELITEKIKKKVKFIAPILFFPGGKELIALAESVESVLTGKIAPLHYPS